MRVLAQREPLRDFERRPKPVTAPSRNGIGRSDDDVSGERIAGKHILESGVELLGWNFPRAECSTRQARGEQRLAHAPNRAAPQHRIDSIDNGLHVDAAARGDLTKRIGLKAR